MKTPIMTGSPMRKLCVAMRFLAPTAVSLPVWGTDVKVTSRSSPSARGTGIRTSQPGKGQ